MTDQLDEKVAEPAPLTRTAKNHVQVFSIGSLFNQRYKDLVKSKQIDIDPTLVTNTSLITFLQKKITDARLAGPTTSIISSGDTLGQSAEQAKLTANNNGAGLLSDGLKVLSQALANEINDITYDPFVLADISRDFPVETSYFLSLYSQMQRAAQNENDNVEFWLVLYNENHLMKIRDFFNTYPQFKPANLTLHLALSSREPGIEPVIIDGGTFAATHSKHPTDYNYRENTLAFSKLFAEQYAVPHASLRMIDDLLPRKPELVVATESNQMTPDDAAQANENNNETYRVELNKAQGVIEKFFDRLKSHNKERPDTNTRERVTFTKKDPNSDIEKAKKALYIYRQNRISDKRHDGEYFTLFGKWWGMTLGVKMSTSEKLLKLLDGDKNVKFDIIELEAARNGKLGEAVAAIEKLELAKEMLMPLHRAENANINRVYKHTR